TSHSFGHSVAQAVVPPHRLKKTGEPSGWSYNKHPPSFARQDPGPGGERRGDPALSRGDLFMKESKPETPASATAPAAPQQPAQFSVDSSTLSTVYANFCRVT